MSIVGDIWEPIVDKKNKKIEELEREIEFLKDENRNLQEQIDFLQQQYIDAQYGRED